MLYSFLKDLIQNATNSGHPTHEELNSFGCKIPNCKNTVWAETKSELYEYPWEDYMYTSSEIYQYFPNKAEVFYQKLISKSTNSPKKNKKFF